MDAIELLLEEHKTAKDLMEGIKRAEQGGDTETFATLVDTLTMALERHSELEKAYLYPAMEQHEGEVRQMALTSLEEHRLADQLVSELRDMGAADEQFMAKAMVLCENVEHHVQEEEEEIFPTLQREMGDELEALGEQMLPMHEQTLQELGMAEEASSDGQLLDLTRDELYQKAKDANVEGASKMTKDQLVEALSGQQG